MWRAAPDGIAFAGTCHPTLPTRPSVTLVSGALIQVSFSKKNAFFDFFWHLFVVLVVFGAIARCRVNFE